MDVTLAIFGIASLLFSGIFHEQAHARVALWLGDPTAKGQHRLSWNPVHHIDPWMSIALPLLLLVSSGGRFWFGGMKPVRINPLNFENPTLGMALSAAAGPVSNAILAAAGFGVLWGLHQTAPAFVFDAQQEMLTFNGLFLCVFIFTNVLLGTFNLLPLPGLDGSRVLYHFLPRGGRAFMDAIEPYGLMITMLAVSLGAAAMLLPVYRLVLDLFGVSFGWEFTQVMWHRIWPAR